MIPYHNSSNNAGVTAYEPGADFIIVKFQDGRVYLYNHEVTGKTDIEQMKVLALNGEGLTTFINQHVKDKYAKRLL